MARRRSDGGLPDPSPTARRASVEKGASAGDEAITVAIRIRPFAAYEKSHKACLHTSGKICTISQEDESAGAPSAKARARRASITDKGSSKEFLLDVVMNSAHPRDHPDYCSQEQAYDLVGRHLLDHALNGFNTCLFCYGQTGTGKTTTIMGVMEPKSEQGLLLRLMGDLFATAERQPDAEFQVTAQMLEVYNEQIYDLIAPQSDRHKKIQVHCHPELGVYIKGATQTVLANLSDTLDLVEYGNTMKTVHATAMNAQSSRGHTIFKVNMTRAGKSENKVATSEIYFADLAGRENEKTAEVTGDRFVELSFINKSLMWLTACIQALGTIKKGTRSDMAKFRNSKLTLLLSNALCGNSRTTMVGTLSPAIEAYEESLSTLKFTQAAKKVRVNPKQTVEVDKETMISNLQAEIERLKEELKHAHDADKLELVDMLEATEDMAKDKMQNWSDLQRQAQEQAMARLEVLQGFGRASARLARIAVIAGSYPLPYLANYSDDPHLAFNLVFHIPDDGKEHVAGMGEHVKFKLPSAFGICEEHCTFRNKDGRLILTPCELPHVARPQGVGNAPLPTLTEINCEKVTGMAPRELSHRDAITFGCTTLFYAFMRACSPEDVNSLLPQAALEAKMDTSDDQLIAQVIGEERAADEGSWQATQQYCAYLEGRHLAHEGRWHSFLHSCKKAKKLVEEANVITTALRPRSGLTFELAAQAPILAFGFLPSNFPELGVRLVRRLTQARLRWQRAFETISLGNSLSGAIKRIERFATHGPAAGGVFELVLTCTWPQFLRRLQLLHGIYANWCENPEEWELDPTCDPWAEHGPGVYSLAGMRRRASTRRQTTSSFSSNLERSSVSSRSHSKESNFHHSHHGHNDYAVAQAQLEHAAAENVKLRAQLQKAQAKLQEAGIKFDDADFDALDNAKVTENGGHSSKEMRTPMQLVSQCVEISKANQKLVEKFMHDIRGESLPVADGQGSAAPYARAHMVKAKTPAPKQPF